MKLSIIIPVYNVERYLSKCLDSCLNQNVGYDQYEVIAVNDGSPDNSGLILEDYKNKYKNLRVLNQSNQGLSAARNNGLQIAKGKFVWFVDSDDSLEDNVLPEILNNLTDDIDLLQLKYQQVYEDGRSPDNGRYPYIWEGVLSGKEILIKGGLPGPAQFTVYRKNFLDENNLHFAEGRLHEDIEFKPRATYLAKGIRLLDLTCYNYLIRSSGSIMSSFKLKNAIDLIYAIDSILDFKNNVISEKDGKKSINRFIGLYFNTLLKVYDALNDSERAMVKTMIMSKKYILDAMSHSGKMKYMMEGLVFKINPSIGIATHRLLK